MLPLRQRLERASKRTGLRLDVLQQDYLLGWILKAIFQEPQLQSSLVFKGGTALKKCYFGDYRFSEDLDFSAMSNLISSTDLLKVIVDMTNRAEAQMRDLADIRLFAQRYTENEPHPNNQEAFKIRAQYPWQKEPLTVVMIEISRDELLLCPATTRDLIHEYEEAIEQKIVVYSLEEVILEKLRAILQHTKKLHERDWNRSRARDYYDLWSILNRFHNELNLKNLPQLLEKKCSHRQVSFVDDESFFNEKMLENVRKTWNQWLGPLVPHLPTFDTVMNELRPKIAALLNV